MSMRCLICGGLAPTGRATCSAAHHEQLVAKLEEHYGKFKKVVRASTGAAFAVPTRDIVERGLNETELDRYPRWEERDG